MKKEEIIKRLDNLNKVLEDMAKANAEVAVKGYIGSYQVSTQLSEANFKAIKSDLIGRLKAEKRNLETELKELL